MNKRLYAFASMIVLLSMVSMGTVAYLQGDFKTLEAKITKMETTHHEIALSGDSASSSSQSVTVQGNQVELTSGGVFEVTGNAKTVEIIVSKEIREDVTLILNNATLASIDFQSTGTNILQLANDSSNSLSHTQTALKASNITLTGSGTLSIPSVLEYGIFATEDLVVESGHIVIDSQGFGLVSQNDADPSHGNITINGGVITINTAATEQTGAIYAGNRLTINNGSLSIEEAYEGYIAKTIAINGGTASLKTVGNGIVGQQITAESSEEGVAVQINGGKTTVSSSQHAIFSAGTIALTNGTNQLAATNGQFSAIQYGQTATMDGGYLWSFGQTAFTSAQQVFVSTSLYGTAGDTITLSDAAGTTLATYEAPEEFSVITFSSPDLQDGAIYYLSTTSGNYGEAVGTTQSYIGY